MGVAIVISPCAGCGVPFGYNPHRVPSLRRTLDSPREPICLSCVERANPIRKARGLPEIEVLEGAYDAIPESTL